MKRLLELDLRIRLLLGASPVESLHTAAERVLREAPVHSTARDIAEVLLSRRLWTPIQRFERALEAGRPRLIRPA